jgi:hypothetical protein
MEKLPVLYVFVRTDLPSMTPGKAQAHSGHAANAFINQHYIRNLRNGKTIWGPVTEWIAATPHGFGTQINLKAPWKEVVEVVATICETKVGKGELINDPTYPYIVDSEVATFIDSAVHSVPMVDLGDGRMLCHRHELTAAYVFGYKEDLAPYINKYPLHP